VSTVSSEALDASTERHHLSLSADPPAVAANPLDAVKQNGHAGVVIALTSGIPDRTRLEIIEAALSRGQRVWLHWPGEQAVECIDAERLHSLRRHRQIVIAME